MNDRSVEDRLRAAARAYGDAVRPDEEASMDRIRTRGNAALRRRRAVVAGLSSVVVVVAGVLLAVELTDDDSRVEVVPAVDDTTTTVDGGSTTVTSVPEPEVIDDAIWPPADHEQYDDPVGAATSFVEEYVGIPNPAFSSFSPGDPDSGHLDLYLRGEDGPVRDDIVKASVYLRRGPAGWVVIGATSPDVELDSPQSLGLVQSPVRISGRGRGYEATLLASVRDGAGNTLVQEILMGGCCEELEPFDAQVPLPGTPPTANGSVLVMNTSGLEDGVVGFVAVPIRFADAVTTFQVYFHRAEQVVAVERTVPKTTAVLRAALTALLAGPMPSELVTSPFSDDTAGLVLDVRLSDGVAVVDFDAALPDRVHNWSASAMSQAVLDELAATIFQFATVQRVELRLDGSCEAFYESMERVCTTLER